MEATDIWKQQHEALDIAREVKAKRAKLKQQIRDRRRNPINILKDPPDYAERMKIDKFLAAVPGLGKNKVYRLLRVCETSPHTTLGDLSDRQRLVISRGIKEKIWLNR